MAGREGRSASPRASASAYRGSAGLRRVPVRRSAREPVRARPLHRLLGRRRLCRAGGRRRAHCLPLPAGGSDAEIAPLLCAGLIGYRGCACAASPSTRPLRLRGLGAHRLPGGGAPGPARVRVHATRGHGHAGVRARARCRVGGGSDERPEELDAAIIFAPVGELVTVALRALAPGGAVVCAGIHMTDIPSFRYADLWGERQIRSVEPHPPRRRGVPRAGAAHPGQDDGDRVRARGGRRGARRPAVRSALRRPPC